MPLAQMREVIGFYILQKFLLTTYRFGVRGEYAVGSAKEHAFRNGKG